MTFGGGSTPFPRTPRQPAAAGAAGGGGREGGAWDEGGRTWDRARAVRVSGPPSTTTHRQEVVHRRGHDVICQLHHDPARAGRHVWLVNADLQVQVRARALPPVQRLLREGGHRRLELLALKPPDGLDVPVQILGALAVQGGAVEGASARRSGGRQQPEGRREDARGAARRRRTPQQTALHPRRQRV